MMAEPVFPLSLAYLPGDPVVLRVFEPRYVAMLDGLAPDRPSFVSVMISRGPEVGGGDVRVDQGVRVVVMGLRQEDPVVTSLWGRATDPITVTRWLPDDPFPRAEVAPQIEVPLDEAARHDVAGSLSSLARSLLKDGRAASSTDPLVGELSVVAGGAWWGPEVPERDLWLALWIVARCVSCGPYDRHQMLRPGDLTARVARLGAIIRHVSELATFGVAGPED